MMDNERYKAPIADSDNERFSVGSVYLELPEDTAQPRGQSLPAVKLEGSTDSVGANIVRTSAFERLPEEIIERILYLTDPNTFASLILISSKWRLVAQTPHLFAHHLSRCPSFSVTNNVIGGPFTEDDLPRLQRQFHLEVKRNLFESFLHPRQTVIKLISTSTSSSAAFPGGEAFRFSFSPNGHWLLALSSSRIYVLNTSQASVVVRRELKVLRRPVSTAILDDGSMLAVLSTDHQVNLYDLTGFGVRHLRCVRLENAPRTIALSPTGSVLAAAYDKGIEVYSLAPGALSTDRRAVKCEAVDALSFSSDGTVLLGTTINSKQPNTVVLSAAYFNDGGQSVEASHHLSQMWTTQILFPHSSKDCSHSILLPHSIEGDTSWTFTHDQRNEAFRVISLDEFRNGVTKAAGSLPTGRIKKLIPTTLPTTNVNGELVAAGFLSKEIWLFGIPETLQFAVERQGLEDSADNLSAMPLAPNNTEVGPLYREIRVTENDSDTNDDNALWRTHCETSQNVLTNRYHLADVSGLSALRWVSSEIREGKLDSNDQRLIAVAPGGVSDVPDDEGEDMVPVDGGRIFIFDFRQQATNRDYETIIIELGDNEPESLEEESRDLDTEIDIVRRRTVAQRRGGPDDPRRRNLEQYARANRRAVSDRDHLSTPNVPPMPYGHHFSASSPSLSLDEATSSSVEDDLTSEEIQAAFDDPYSLSQPRSRATLLRAATAVAANRRNPVVPHHPSSGHVEYRRADGRREHPHESDADNWVPPPPPYTPDADGPLPEHLLLTLMARSTNPVHRVTPIPYQPIRSSTTFEGVTQMALQRTRSTMERSATLLRVRRSTSRGATTELPSTSSTDSQERDPHSRRDQLGLWPVASFNDTEPRPDLYAISAPTSPTERRHSELTSPGSDVPPVGTPESLRSTLHSPISPIPEFMPSFQEHRRFARNSAPPLPYLSLSPQPTPPIPYTDSPTEEETLVSIPSPHARRLPPSPQSTPRSYAPPSPAPSSASLTRSPPIHERRSFTNPVPLVPSNVQSTTSIQPLQPSQRVVSLPVTPRNPIPHLNGPLPPVPPSAEQLANLQNRYSQPIHAIRRRPVAAAYINSLGHPPSMAPRAAHGAAGSRSPPSVDSLRPLHRSISRSNSRGSNNSSRRMSLVSSQSSPGYNRSPPSISAAHSRRPPVHRLDTIQSVVSRSLSITSRNSLSRSKLMNEAGALLPRRAPSRAERSAAINVQEAKKRGWGGGGGKKKKATDGKSGCHGSNEWTDVGGVKGEVTLKKGQKCIVM
ncbi:MAG: hypothetical protein M1827_003756 [Pycnora praestabilis]|nr:MAG: hypothetical protein M1827_003756 [Pycnora praestabilis]